MDKPKLSIKLPTRPIWMEQGRYEDLCHLFEECNGDYRQFEDRINSINKGLSIIHICHTCGKVDISPLTHYRDCDPEGEYERQQAQDVYWK